MSEKILVPALGESITEATVSKWLKNEGDSVEADEPIVELETDKVNLEVPSPVTGQLSKINSKDGSVVQVGEILGSVSENGSKTEKSDEIMKIQPTNLKKNEELNEEDNVIKLDPIKEKKELDIFEEKVNKNNIKEEPLVLTDEIESSETKKNSSEENKASNERKLQPIGCIWVLPKAFLILGLATPNGERKSFKSTCPWVLAA